MEYETIALPPNLSESDAERDRELRIELARLQREYQDRAEPLVKQLTEIHARYLPRAILVPKSA